MAVGGTRFLLGLSTMSNLNLRTAAGIAIASTVVMLAAPASATIITTTQTITFGLATTDWTNTQSFNLFNTNLGTLTNVRLRSSVNTAFSYSGTNTSGGTVTTTVISNNQFSLSGSGNSGGVAASLADILISGGINLAQKLNTSFNAGAISTPSFSGNSTDSALVTTSSSVDGWNASGFAAAGGGTGTFTAGVTSSTGCLFNPAGQASCTVTNQAAETITLTYTYDNSTAVPPPAGLAPGRARARLDGRPRRCPRRPRRRGPPQAPRLIHRTAIPKRNGGPRAAVFVCKPRLTASHSVAILFFLKTLIFLEYLR